MVERESGEAVTGPKWGAQWEPRRISFGGDPNPLDPSKDLPPRIVRLDGGFEPPPIPPDFQAPPQAPLVKVIEPSQGWWNQEGAFGYRYQGQIPPLAGTTIALTEQLRLPGPPRLWWIHWFRYSRSLGTEGSTPYGTWDLRGRVTYGVGGVQNIVEVDVMTGIQMALVASSIKVDLVTYAPLFDASGAAIYDPGELGVIAGAMFGDGAAGGALPPTWSTPVYETDGAGALTLDVPLPDFARSLSLHTSVSDPATLAGVQIFFNSPGITLKAVDVSEVYQLLTSEKGIAIPAQTNQVRLVVNDVALAGEYFSLQFYLAL